MIQRIAALLLLASTLIAPALPAHGDSSVKAPPPVVAIGEDFVGIRSAASAQSRANTITWTGDTETGEVEVVWAARPPKDLRDDEGRPIAPRHVGALHPDVARKLESELRPRVEAARSWGGGIVLCSLVVAEPYWNASPAQARGGVSQVCSNHTIHRVTEVLLKQVGLSYQTMDADDSGWQTGSFVSALGVRACSSSTARNWSNVGHGEAIRNGVHFNGPSEAATRRLGCG